MTSEIDTVVNTYNTIAKSFDKTRYSVWNCVKEFTLGIDKFGTTVEVGCGNGKNMIYLQSNGFEKVCGCDVSTEFVNICKNKHLNVMEANILNLPYESNTFDNVLCVAVIHHLTTKHDRILAIKELLRITKQNGSIFISVSSVEKLFSKHCRKLNDNNDYAIDWNCSGSERFYHLFENKELESLCYVANDNKHLDITSKSEYGNWIVHIKKI